MIVAPRVGAASSPQIAIGDASVSEGDAKVRSALFPVTLSEPSLVSVTVDYVIAGVTATPGKATTSGVDFNHKGGTTKTLTFLAGQVAKYVAVSVYADTVAEPTETFEVTISNASGGYDIGRGRGTGTIYDDDVDPSNRLTVGDASVPEGDTTKRTVKFRVTLSQQAAAPVTVDYNIVPVTATGGYASGPVPTGTDIRDYTGATKTLAFNPSPVSGLTAVMKTIAVAVYPDTELEGNETFEIQLSNVTGPATLADATGAGTIIDDDGPSLWAWGENTYGQVGDGTLTHRSSPKHLALLASSWASVEAGAYHSLAVSDGKLIAWGGNAAGQLGDGTTTDRTLPIQIGTETNWAQVAAGYLHSAAVRADGTLWTWGYNAEGILGNGTSVTSCPGTCSPVQVGSDTNWAQVAVGTLHTVAVRTDGTLWTWGYNGYGQLGDGTGLSRLSPVQIGTDTNWASVAAGYGHTVAVRTDGTLWTWGWNDDGQLGNGTSSGITYSPNQLGSDTNWASVAAGDYYTLAVRIDGTLWGWGYNTNGNLGTGNTVEQMTPTQIGSDADWASVAAGYHTVAIRTNGTLWSWGWNAYGQLGLGTNTMLCPDTCSPSQVGTDTTWVAVAAGSSHTIAVHGP
jgi:alpha-tubulin suppressor-like RCC1 family protein